MAQQQPCERGRERAHAGLPFKTALESARPRPRGAGAPELCERSALSIQRRAQGRPGAGRTHGPRANENARGRNHRYEPNNRRVQTVVATLIVFTDDSSSSSASAGVFQPSVFLGRALRAAATADMSSALWILRSEPFGKYCRSNPLVFSFVPRCQGLLGSQK